MNDAKMAWTMVYASILGISYHPRQLESGHPGITPEDAAKATDEAMAPWLERWGDNGRAS